MTPERWERVTEIFEKALSVHGQEREAYLRRTCADDSEIRHEVESLLASHEQAGSGFLNASEVPFEESVEKEKVPGVQAGRRIGPYLVTERIGHGGMGEVFAAGRADGQYEKKVALKLVRTGYDTSFVLERFRNERQILASLDHSNIARLLDGGTTEEGIPYLVMELVEGAPIDAYCDANKLSVTERLQLFRQVCSAAQYAHQHLVIHRDIKPSNILVTKEGIPKLLDFGIAKILDPSGSTEATMLRPMTPEYASPEQVRGDHITTASDIYSLGVVLYQLLTGHSPYRIPTRTPQNLAHAIAHTDPDRPSTVVSHSEEVQRDGGTSQVTPESVSRTREGSSVKLHRRLRGDLDYIVLKALRKEPQSRYASVDQFAEDIRRHLDGLPVTARKGTLSYRTAKFARRHRAAVAAAALLAIAVLGGVASTLRQARRADRRFNDVRKLANSLIFEISDSIADLPGATKARSLIVQRSLEYLDSLEKESGNDPELLRELATAYERIGSVQGNPQDPNLGDTKAALVNLQKSLALRESLVRSNPKNSKDQVELAAAYMDVGDFQTGAAGNVAAAFDYYKKAGVILEREAATSPNDFRIFAQGSRAFLNLGFTQLGNGANGRTGNISDGVAALQKAQVFVHRAIEIKPSSLAVQGQEGSILLALGDAFAIQGDRPAALNYYQRGAAILDSLNTKAENVRLASNLAVATSKIATILQIEGKDSEALSWYEKALQEAENLASKDRNNEGLQRLVVTSTGQLGHALAEDGRAEDAVKTMRKALAEAEATPSQTPVVQTLEGIGHDYLGEAVERQGKVAEALVEYDKSKQLLAGVRKVAREDPRLKVYFVMGAGDLAEVLAKQGRLADAAKQYDENVALLEPVASARSDDLEVLYALAETYTGEGNVATKLAVANNNPGGKLANWQAARDWFQKSANTWKKVPHPAFLSTSGMEVTMPDEVARRLAHCDREIKSLATAKN